MALSQWSGEFVVPVARTGFWRIGPMQLWLQRLSREWRVVFTSSNDPAEQAIEVLSGADGPSELPESLPPGRYFFRQTPERVRVGALLADRPIVSRPETAIHLPPGEEVTLYVGSPLWVEVSVGNPAQTLLEAPIVRPSDTWFGPTTQAGGFSYAATTLALPSLDGYPFSPVRAVTPLRIRNRAETMLHIDRLNLPVPFLSLYRSASGVYWTETITLDRDEDDEALALLNLSKSTPPEAGECVLVSKPRRKAGKNLVVHAFSVLFK